MKRILLFLNGIAITALLAAYLAPFVNPLSFWPIAFFGLLFPLFLVMNLLFILLWAVKWKKYFWLSLLTILIGGPYIQRYIQSRDQHKAHGTDKKSIEILSYNVRLFDLYNWKDNKNELMRDSIYRFLEEQDADVLCLQEYYSNDSNDFSSIGDLVKLLDATFSHAVYTTSIGPAHWGIVTFSRFPIVKRGQVTFKTNSNNVCIFTDIQVGNDTLRIYNAHLGSIHLGYKEYGFFNKLGGRKGSRDSSGPLGVSEQLNNSLKEDVDMSTLVTRTVKLVKNSFMIRAEQARAVADHATCSPYPVVICGDINDTPVSYAYEYLSDGRNDAFVNAGSGFGNTYAGAIPWFRIDYIFCNDSMDILEFNTLNKSVYSDHYPIRCKVGL